MQTKGEEYSIDKQLEWEGSEERGIVPLFMIQGARENVLQVDFKER